MNQPQDNDDEELLALAAVVMMLAKEIDGLKQRMEQVEEIEARDGGIPRDS